MPCRELFRAGAAYDLPSSSIAFPICRLCYWCRLCGPPATLLYYLLVFSPLNIELVLPMHLFCKSLLLLFRGSTMKLPAPLQEGMAMEWPTCSILSGSSSWAHPSPHHSFISAPPHVPRLPIPFSPYFSFALLHTSSPSLSTETIYPSFCPPTHFLFLQILLMISPGFPLCTSLLRLLLPSSLHIKIINSHPCYHSPLLITPTSPPFRRCLLRIVLRFFGYCPRAGLFAATTLSRFWNSVATYALAVSCAFYAVFASPSQDKLGGLWGGCSFTFHYCFTTFA